MGVESSNTFEMTCQRAAAAVRGHGKRFLVDEAECSSGDDDDDDDDDDDVEGLIDGEVEENNPSIYHVLNNQEDACSSTTIVPPQSLLNEVTEKNCQEGINRKQRKKKSLIRTN